MFSRLMIRALVISGRWPWAIALSMAAALMGAGCQPAAAPPDAPPPQHSHAGHDEAAHSHAGHDHDEPGETLNLSPQSRRSLNIETLTVSRGVFVKSLTLPAMIVERPGATRRDVGTHFSGIITQIAVSEGQAVKPGDELAHLHLVHEELVQSQTDLLRTVEELNVVGAEIKRLSGISAEGVIAGKTFLERQYELQKLEALLKAQRQALLLHGLPEADVNKIIEKRELLHGFDIVVPKDDEGSVQPAFWQVEKIMTHVGQHTDVGQSICRLTDYGQLDLEGIAFESDLSALHDAVASNATVMAVFERPNKKPIIVDGLRIVYVANQVDPQARTLKFVVRLPNEIERDVEIDGRRYVSWRFRPGQRLQLRVPVETWQDRFVLPATAVVQDKLESYVFIEEAENEFHRHRIAIEYRDPQSIVVAKESELKAGDRVVSNGAEALELAWMQKSGGQMTGDGHSH